MIFFWILIGYSIGIYNTLFVILIPMALANFGILSYISTNHYLMPLTKINHPLLNSMSLKTLKIFDIIHFNFSHHVEHHIFPTLHWKYYPIVRQYLMKNVPKYYVCPSHFKALIYLYKTPREYKDNNTLFSSETGECFSIEKIHNEMQGNAVQKYNILR
jgi:fatty acid desaturase